jgi:hypothetical protein
VLPTVKNPVIIVLDILRVPYNLKCQEYATLTLKL